MSLLEIDGLRAGYGKATIVRNVQITVDSGESVAMVGRNGAGKTTLLHSLFGLADVFDGRITVDGTLHEPARSGRAAELGLALAPQGRRILPRLTVKENLQLGAAAKRRGQWSLEAVYDLFPVLRERAGKPGNALSGGQQQMLAIGRSLMANPRLLFLDEPTEGLAPVIIHDLVRVFREIQQTGTALFIVEQHLGLVRGLADRILVLSKGEVVGEAGPDSLETPAVKELLAL